MRKEIRVRSKKVVRARSVRFEPELEKEEVSIKLIRGLWDSLESHLDYCVEGSPEGKSFHRQCVREYAGMIELASKLLSE